MTRIVRYRAAASPTSLESPSERDSTRRVREVNIPRGRLIHKTYSIIPVALPSQYSPLTLLERIRPVKPSLRPVEAGSVRSTVDNGEHFESTRGDRRGVPLARTGRRRRFRFEDVDRLDVSRRDRRRFTVRTVSSWFVGCPLSARTLPRRPTARPGPYVLVVRSLCLFTILCYKHTCSRSVSRGPATRGPAYSHSVGHYVPTEVMAHADPHTTS